MRLVMTAKQRPSLDDVGPFCEPGTPPSVVLGDRVKLREVKRDQPHVVARTSCAAFRNALDASHRVRALSGIAAEASWPPVEIHQEHSAPPLGTAVIRSQILAAWRDKPAFCLLER